MTSYALSQQPVETSLLTGPARKEGKYEVVHDLKTITKQ
jgi:hypothetical protein